MHFEGRLCQQNSRIPAFVRKLFVYFVIRKEIEHKNVKKQVLEPLPANVPLKKSQPIRRQVRSDCLQTLEIWLLFQHWQHWKEGGGCVLWFKMFVITKDIEHKNVKRQVLEPLSANVPPKKSQPIRRQVRFDCLQNLESWWLFQHWQGGRGAVILRFRLAGPYWQSVYIITCFYICHFR